MVSHPSDNKPAPKTGSSDSRPVIGITMGDPAGIGAEVIIKALADPAIRKLARYEIYGMNELLSYAADLAEIEPFSMNLNGLLATCTTTSWCATTTRSAFWANPSIVPHDREGVPR
jgi:4-hydroxy-L-threonine phosphate dehydrogenase PdxA